MPRADEPPRRPDRGRNDFARAVTAAEETGADAGLVPSRGMTTGEFARFFRKGEDWVRDEIRAGRLGAVNTSNAVCSRPRYVILPEHVAAFIKARSVSPPPKPVKRRSRRSDEVDFFPD